MPLDDKGDEVVADEKRGNAADRADMYRMGKAQEMRVCVSYSLMYSVTDHGRETFASSQSLAFP